MHKTRYGNIHSWLRKRFGSPEKCSKCGTSGKKVNGRWSIQYALKKGEEHARDIKKYLTLCSSCHATYDSKIVGILSKVPLEDVKKVLNKKIRDLNSIGYNYREISELLSVSKTTVCYALKGRKKTSL